MAHVSADTCGAPLLKLITAPPLSIERRAKYDYISTHLNSYTRFEKRGTYYLFLEYAVPDYGTAQVFGKAMPKWSDEVSNHKLVTKLALEENFSGVTLMYGTIIHNKQTYLLSEYAHDVETIKMPQALQALLFLHGHLLLHGDISTENVMQLPSAEVVLIDWDALHKWVKGDSPELFHEEYIRLKMIQ